MKMWISIIVHFLLLSIPKGRLHAAILNNRFFFVWQNYLLFFTQRFILHTLAQWVLLEICSFDATHVLIFY